MGIRIALDNFGTEYSSFDYVRTYKVARLKIAQRFIEMAEDDDARATTIRTIINLAREMGIEVIAEGVESGGATCASRFHGAGDARDRDSFSVNP